MVTVVSILNYHTTIVAATATRGSIVVDVVFRTTSLDWKVIDGGRAIATPVNVLTWDSISESMNQRVIVSVIVILAILDDPGIINELAVSIA